MVVAPPALLYLAYVIKLLICTDACCVGQYSRPQYKNQYRMNAAGNWRFIYLAIFALAANIYMLALFWLVLAAAKAEITDVMPMYPFLLLGLALLWFGIWTGVVLAISKWLEFNEDYTIRLSGHHTYSTF